ncbi:copper resistance system multicopper oxidase [Novosphingobium cyanobacteriorum]|uniref:Copper resistance system multicopper oxidase n=1 Tax=Novosphingobium cyanobacteriorum TaxID=3024215 RepID=A0ABT6CDS4_9SPHN|nr:copper resistance system multicopper oxidase [Novosphingobium cyanobacteriorum]MDF8332077.1 copper resistance system multicopper oxidase [Novosphingobium cyanobacteriorum]
MNSAKMAGLRRRELLAGAGVVALVSALPARAANVTYGELGGEEIVLTIARGTVAMKGGRAQAVTINGTVPGPLLRLREGRRVRITVRNTLDEPTSIHWHGLLVPFQMDGVPGLSFPGIGPGESFTYDFVPRQSGTYWYHSHSGLQEFSGMYGPLVIEPAGGAAQGREHVVVLSDHSFVAPARILRNLKLDPGYYNRNRQTLGGLLAGKDQPAADRLEWARMRMDPTDIADVTGRVLTYLVNGRDPDAPWTGLYTPGEAVTLRLINAGAMTIFNVRIPGLPLQVVAMDGQPVVPVDVDELQLSPGETCDVVIRPGDGAHALVCESVDRSGMAVGMIAPREGLRAPVPALRQRPILTMRDMGMDMGGTGMSHGGGMDMAAMGHSMAMRDGNNAPQVRLGPGVEMIAPMPVDRTGDPGLGLDARYVPAGHRVLTYRDLVSPVPNPDVRPAEREIEVHLTGSMDRYMWSMDGKTMSEAHEPIPLRNGERVRFTLVNDTMMAHPIHLHGHYFELVTGHGERSPRKHTVSVLPGGKVSFDTTAEAGDWAFHCHMFLHMAMGMMRVVQVRPA